MEQRRYHIVIGSILFAVLAWVSVNLRDEYTITKHFPVVLENLKDGKALKYPIPKIVNVRFRGNGWSLAGLYLSPQITYSIDLSTVGSEDFIIMGRDLLEHVRLPVALQPLDVKPDSIVLALDNYSEKRVPITANIPTAFKDGYGQVGKSTIVPDSVMIGGASNLIEHINSWPTIFSKFDDLHSSLSIEIPLEEPSSHSVNLFTHLIRYQLNVQPFAEKVFTGIPLTAISTPPNREVIFIPPRIDIIVRGGIERLAKLTNEDFKASVSYQNLIQDSSEIIVPTLTVPAEIKIMNKNPERFSYIIRKKL